MKRVLVVVLLVSMATGAGLLGGCGQGAGEEETVREAAATPVWVQTAAREQIENQLFLTGTAEAHRDTYLQPEVPGKVAAVYVDIGERVEAGQALLSLDQDLAAAQLAQAQAGRRSAQARQQQAETGVELSDESTRIGIRQAGSQLETAREQLEKAESAYELTKQQVENSIQQAQLGVESAQSSLRDIESGARSQEVAQAQAQVNQAEASLQLAESNYGRYQELYDKGAVSEQALEGARTEYQVAQNRLQQAEEALSLTREGARSEQVRLAELQVQQAQQQLQLAQARREEIRIAQRDVAAARTGVRQAEDALQLAKEQRRQLEIQKNEAQAAKAAVAQAAAGEQYSRTSLGKHVVRAPFGGYIAERLVDPGAAVSSMVDVLRLVDLDPITVAASVSETDIASLSLGMGARVEVDGLPGEVFSGTIARIAPATEPGQRQFTVEVQVDNPAGRIKPGMFCRLSVVLDTVPDALVVPRDALVENGEQRLVYVVRSNLVEVEPVELGAQSDNTVEILSGVEEGDQVIISGQSLLAKGQEVRAEEVDSIEEVLAPSATDNAIPTTE